MAIVRLGAKRVLGITWKLYDEQYRLRKEHDPTSSWAVVDTELWLLYMSNSSLAPSLGTENSLVQKLDTSRDKFKCYPFNFDGLCPRAPCYYSHICIQCGGSHPLIYCQYQQGRVGNQQPLPCQVRPQLGFRGSRPNIANMNNFTFRQQQQQQRYQRPRFTSSTVGPRPYTH